MLVLSREINEIICIGNDIKIVVVSVRGNKVRLGIEAPREVPVHRQEVYETIQRQKREAENGTATKKHEGESTDGEATSPESRSLRAEVASRGAGESLPDDTTHH